MKAKLEIEMPDGCYDCQFCAGTECSVAEGMPTIDLFGEAERKPKWCPLKPVETEELSNKWIPVAERLPEVELQSAIKERGEYAVVPVLVSAQKRNAEGNAYIVTDRAFYFERFGVKNFHNDKAEPMKVLAWMPLPEPYKEAEG